MYLVGAAHPHKIDAQHALERLTSARERLVTDAEVLQEILHRYAAIRRLDAIQPAFDVLLGVVDDVFPIESADVDRAREVLLARPALSARDSLHVALMKRHRVGRILSFDAGFDTVPGLTRLTR
jgi:predicted nucleic acid-binding protein